MERQELLRSKEYWMMNIQTQLYNAVENFLKKHKLKRTDFASQIGVTKGYVSQVLSGDFDHKLSKMVELSLASGNVPVIHFVNTEKYIEHDAQDKVYDLMPMFRSSPVTYTIPKHGTINRPVIVEMEKSNFSVPI